MGPFFVALFLCLTAVSSQKCVVETTGYVDFCAKGETCTNVGCRCLPTADSCFHTDNSTACTVLNTCEASGFTQCCRSGESCVPGVGCRCQTMDCEFHCTTEECLSEATDYLMPETMKLKMEHRLECLISGYCDSLKRPSVTGAKTDCINGTVSAHGLEYPCKNVDLLSFLSFADLGCPSGSEANDVWGWSKDGRDFVIFGCTSGTSFVEITDPVSPRTMGFLPTASSSSTWRDMKIYKDFAYIVSEASNHGMQGFDLTRLLRETNPGPSNRYTANVTFNLGMGTVNQRSTHNIFINEETGIAYLVGCKTCSGGLLMVDVRTPNNPQSAGCFSADGYTHDVICVIYSGPDHRFQGREICFASNEDTLTIVDVTNKTNPVQISRVPYYGVRYCHQAWLSVNQEYLFMDDELDEMYNTYDTTKKTVTYVWDVANLGEPIQIKEFQSPVQSIDHNQYVRGNHIYQANYASGLRIWNGAAGNIRSDAWTPELVGYFDVHPEADVAQFYGSWSVFPYYSGRNEFTSALTSIERGLYIVHFDRIAHP